ncbi:hypothetical protein F0P96_10805 [Hymenobacter busanensis]|uniref:Uncharacterized protein n=1 Tax=Hymenobacter busanensis TaxID=2607656 RepID=A0A7L4ZXV4_9BACT|nr:hypothetical protein [Hymenobacter busanensis]KAA9333450.1 hypothetical protein F0P96_10805 [Hymenobacter busanensis]QHJ07867.1 hypothetical protein GUY19_11485 [Hymenobacter busanensis]
MLDFVRPDGSVFLSVERDRERQWVYARWQGLQTLETVQQGGLAYVQMLHDEPCPRLLNDHTDLIGSFSEANEWIAQEWTPQILGAGLRYFAQVLSPGIFAQVSLADLHQRIGDQFELRLFPDVETASEWLLSTPLAVPPTAQPAGV